MGSCQAKGMPGGIRVRVHEGCPRCHTPGIVRRGLSTIMRENPRSVWPGLYWLFYASLAVPLVVFAWLPLVRGPLGAGGVAGKSVLPVLGAGLFLLIGWCLFRKIPLNAMMCAECREIIEWHLGRRIPVSWQERCIPSLACMCCGYSLYGATTNRCPECGEQFPVEWLKVTQAGDPTVPFDWEVVPDSAPSPNARAAQP